MTGIWCGRRVRDVLLCSAFFFHSPGAAKPLGGGAEVLCHHSSGHVLLD